MPIERVESRQPEYDCISALGKQSKEEISRKAQPGYRVKSCLRKQTKTKQHL